MISMHNSTMRFFKLGFQFFFLLMISHLAQGQSNPYYQQGIKAYQEGSIKEAKGDLKKALKDLQTDDNSNQLASSIFKLLTIKLESPSDTSYQKQIDQLKKVNDESDDPLPQLFFKVAKAEVFIKNFKEKKAIEELKEALAILKSQGPNQALHHYQLRVFKDFIQALKRLQRFDETDKYFQRGLKLINQNSIDAPKDKGLFYWSYGDILEETGRFDSGMLLIKKGLGHLYEKFPANHFVNLPLYNDIAAIHKNKQTKDSALHYYNLGIKTLQSNNMINTSKGGVFFMNRGIVYKHMKMHHLALRHFQKSRSIFNEVLPKTHPQKIYLYLNLASISNQLEHFQKALDYNDKALRQIQKQPNPDKYKNLKAVALYTLGDSHTKLDNYEKGINIYNKTVDMLKAMYGPDYLSVGSCYFILADLYYNVGAYQKSLDYVNKGIKIYKGKRGPNHPSIAHFGHIKKAKNFKKLHQYDLAKKALNKAFEINSTNFEPNSEKDNPRSHSLINKNTGFFTANKKANLFIHLYDSSKALEHLLTAYKACQFADTILQQKLQSIDLQADKSYFVKKSDDFYPLGLEIIHKMLRDNSRKNLKKAALMKNAYRFAENDKATMLTTALSSRKILSTNKLPDSLIDKAENIQNQVSDLNDEIQKTQDSSKTIELKGERLSLLEEKNALYEQIKNQNPKFHQILTKKSQTPLNTLQQRLNVRDKNLIQYVGKDDLLYAMVITPDQTFLHQLPVKDSLQSQIIELRNQVIQDKHEYKEDLAFDLYQRLFKPLEDKLTSNQIVIVPDGTIGYLPFSTLLKNQGLDDKDEKPHYLINDYAFSYSPSASLWNFPKQENKTKTENQYLGFAPSTDREGEKPLKISSRNKVRGPLGELPYARKEIQNTLQILEGKSYVGENATEFLFKQKAHEANIIHLATHGILNDNRPAYNRLLFNRTDTSNEDGYLHTYELYELELNADLAVLSACNTGFGTIKKGEGVMSLSRGFKIAGCKNILMTLWSVDDRASAKLIEDFYRYLNNGIDKTQALRKAKLDYLKSNDAINANPYYWAGYVMMGSKNQLAISESSKTRFWWLLGGVLIVLIPLLSLYLSKKSKKKAS